ncbi:MAG TPA: hypothetical protein DIU35_02220 [Candidatus Latescibacteria bacterium]|nr:hypothetical protein [Candidatus Latescibacterota bacterium]
MAFQDFKFRLSLTLSGQTCRQGIVVGLVVMLLLVPLYFSPLFHDYEIPKIVIFQTITILLAVLGLVGMVLDGEISILDTSLYYTFLGFLAVHFISLYQASNVFQGLDLLFRYLCYFLLPVLVFHTVRTNRGLIQLAGVMALTGSIVAVVGLLQHNGVYSFNSRWNIPISTIGNVNFVAEYYNVVFPIAITLLFIPQRFWICLGALLSCFLMSCHLVVLGSRGGWLGATVALVIMGIVVAIRHFRISRRILDTVVVVVVVIGLGCPVAASLLSDIPVGADRTLGHLTADYWERTVNRTEDALKLKDDSSQQRVLLWEDTLRLVLDRPLFGVGVGNFEYHIPAYTSRQSLEVKMRMEEQNKMELMAYSAHNEYLEVWAETGILGLAFFCVLMYQISVALLKLLKRYLRGEETLLVVGLAGAFAATLTHSFFSTNLHDPASAVHFWIVVGMVWSLKMNAEGEGRLGLLLTEARGVALGLISAGMLVLTITVVLGVQTLLGAYNYCRGMVWFQREDYVEAAEFLEKASAYRYTHDFAVFQNLGMSLYNENKYEDAAMAFQKSLFRHRNNASASYYLGRTLSQLGRTDAALPHLKKSVDLNPLSAEYRTGWGEALGREGRGKEAIRELKEAVHLDPNAWEAVYALGYNYKEAGNYAEAISAYRKALALKPGKAEVTNSLAVGYSLNKEYENAHVLFARVAEDYPKRSDYQVNLAVSFLNLGKLENARLACQQALRIDANNAKAFAVTGSVYEAAGDVERAKLAYREALKRNPDDEGIRDRVRALEAGQ